MHIPTSLKESFNNALDRLDQKNQTLGLVGKPVGGNRYILQAPEQGRVYVRLLNDDGQVTSITTAINMGSNLDPFIRVILRKVNGELTIVSPVPSDAKHAYGNRASQAAVPPHVGSIGGGLDDYVESQRLTMGLVIPATQGGLFITVLPFRYRNEWIALDDYEIDSGNIPANDYETCLTYIYYDPITEAIVEETGTVSLRDVTSYDQTDIDSILIPDGVIPLAAITLYNGQTAINDGTARILDAREFINDIQDRTEQLYIPILGTLAVGVHPLRFYNNFGVTKTITKVFLAVNTAPTDDDVIVDVLKDGSTIFSVSPLPQIDDAAFTGEVDVIDDPLWLAEEYLSVEVTNIGSTVEGSDLVVHIVYR